MFEIPGYQGWDPSVAMSLSQCELKHKIMVGVSIHLLTKQLARRKTTETKKKKKKGGLVHSETVTELHGI